MKSQLTFRIIPAIFLIFMLGISNAQVKHNYLLGPQKTTCDSLDIQNGEPLKILQKIKDATWRYTQSIHLNRPYGFRHADFYSCDVQSGFLVIEIDDKNYIYEDVPVTLWEEFSKTIDPDGFIDDKIKGKFERLEDK